MNVAIMDDRARTELCGQAASFIFDYRMMIRDYEGGSARRDDRPGSSITRRRRRTYNTTHGSDSIWRDGWPFIAPGGEANDILSFSDRSAAGSPIFSTPLLSLLVIAIRLDRPAVPTCQPDGRRLDGFFSFFICGRLSLGDAWDATDEADGLRATV